jgi:hypothetical protein
VGVAGVAIGRDWLPFMVGAGMGGYRLMGGRMS